MTTENWEISSDQITFEDFEGIQTLSISGGGEATLKNRSFYKGTIEFDFMVTGRSFCGIYFRRQEGENRTPTFHSEFYYLRAFKMDDPLVSGAVQYAPITRGTNLWDMLHDYEGNANIKGTGWNKIKLVISEKQMKCYLNGDLVLWIPELMSVDQPGKITLEGLGRYANFKITPDLHPGLPSTVGADVTQHDPRYIRDWEFSNEAEFERTATFGSLPFPDSTTQWTPITAQRFGLINLTKEISSPFTENTRKVIWLRTTIESSSSQLKKLNIGFSDDIFVFINGRLLNVDMNTYNQPIAKNPNGRLHIDNSTINLPLQEGSNELMIAVANDFFGWGLVARLSDMIGITGKMIH